MLGKRNVVSFAITALAVVGIMCSSSTGEPVSQKKEAAKKTATTTVQPSSKQIVGAVAVDSVKKTVTVTPKEDRQLVVYYFMTTARCQSCHFIEETTKAAINENFAAQLKSGRIVFKMLNIEESPNEHFVQDYKLYTKSVVLSDLKAGKETRWINLDKVWQLIGEQKGFRDYIVKEVNAYLGV